MEDITSLQPKKADCMDDSFVFPGAALTGELAGTCIAQYPNPIQSDQARPGQRSSGSSSNYHKDNNKDTLRCKQRVSLGRPNYSCAYCHKFGLYTYTWIGLGVSVSTSAYLDVGAIGLLVIFTCAQRNTLAKMFCSFRLRNLAT